MFPTSEPGPVNGLADVAGIFLGHAEVDSSGVTVVACPDGAVGAVDVRGGGPGTRETDLLKPSNSMESVHAVALCGGSAFGLDAAGGVMAGLEARGIGFPVFGEGVPGPIVPIVPAAVIFDLPVGEASSRPTAETGRAALDAALDNATDSTTDSAQDAAAALGNVGAGHAAVAGAVKGGFGEASSVIAGEPGSLPGAGRTVAVGLVVNPVGSIADPSDGTLWSAEVAQEHPADLGGDGTGGTLPEATEEGLAAFLERGMAGMKFPSGAPESLNTTIGVVATDAPVTKAQAERLAMAVHDGLSRAIRPAHLPMDGDTVFALAPSGVRTGQSAAASDNTGSDNASDTVDQMELAVLSAAAATCAERAVARAVLNADSAFGIPAWADIITGGTP